MSAPTAPLGEVIPHEIYEFICKLKLYILILNYIKLHTRLRCLLELLTLHILCCHRWAIVLVLDDDRCNIPNLDFTRI
jgi:hypothetical protein